MKKIREVLRLRYDCGLSHAKIAKAVQIGETTVGEYLLRFKTAEGSWPLSAEIDDEALTNLLYPPKPHSSIQRNLPDFALIHKEYQRKGVTLNLLWTEYTSKNSNTLAYSRFCELYKEWCVKRDVWMPQQHKFGEETYIDYSGLTVRVYTSRLLDEYFDAQIFVGVLGASGYTYIEATATQQLHDWIASHNRMWSFFHGVSDLAIPDNLKSGVTIAHRYEPSINPTYLEMAQHYGCSVVPARAKKPKDKAKVEKTVRDIQNLILGPIRDQHFFCLDDLNRVLWKSLDDFNKKPFQKLPGSRFSLYQEFEKPALKPLPEDSYEFAHWSKYLVTNNYHVCVKMHHYSVPYRYVRHQVEIKYNERTVEIFFKGKQIAIHPCNSSTGGYTTNAKHCPPSHQHHLNCNPMQLLEMAKKIGPFTVAWVNHKLNEPSSHMREKERVCLGVLRLAKSVGEARLEVACERAAHYNIFSFKSIESMLKNNQEKIPIQKKEESLALSQEHDNIRGPEYFE